MSTQSHPTKEKKNKRAMLSYSVPLPACLMLDSLLGLLFNREFGGNIFFRNIR
jgi:hypothetical protein